MIGIIYGSSTGNTEKAAEMIAEKIEKSIVRNITDTDVAFIEGCDLLILGTSTWGTGDLQDDWESGVKILREADLSGKKVALFGFGDQESWGDSFVDGMGTLYNVIDEKGAELIGRWSTEGYSYESSTAVVAGGFVGLALDEDNQADMTEERINKWVQQIKEEM